MNRMDKWELIGVLGIFVMITGAALGGAVHPNYQWLATVGALIFAAAICKADQ